jgi:hypothetical protein
MPRYTVWATRWDDTRIINEIPARGLSFSMPLSDHGECSFSATVEPGRSDWRPSVAPPMSGVLIARDGVPVWQGRIVSERQDGLRSFSFQCREWGSFFETAASAVESWVQENDHAIFREIVSDAQAIVGQNVQITLGSTLGSAGSDLTLHAWDNISPAEIFTRVAEAEGGPEWYFGSSGTLQAPTRPLILGDRLGSTTASDVLMYVEDTSVWDGYDAPPTVGLLGGLFPAGTEVPLPGRRGGNVIACSRTRDTARSATLAVAVGDGQDAAQIRAQATATKLLAAGWPKIVRWFQHNTVTNRATLQRHADADLASCAGIATGYNLVTLDGDPDWTDIERGSTMRVVLDTDLYGVRPYTFETRLLNLTVDVPDDGGTPQLTWDLAEVLEAS